MLPTLDKITADLLAMWPWEAIAVVLAIVYLVLAIRENVWCWAAGIASTAIYLALLFRARLYMESGLQVFYIGVSVYGWWEWSRPARGSQPVAARAAPTGQAQSAERSDGGATRAATRQGQSAERSVVGATQAATLPVITWQPRQHAAALGAIGALAAGTGALLAAWTPAALPYLDSLIAWSSIVTTWMVARKVLENWLYWFVIDGISVYIYMRRGLWLTAGLFVIYLVMIVVGFRVWREKWRQAQAPNGAL